MKYCAQCGKPTTALFCAHCGAKSEGGGDLPEKDVEARAPGNSSWNGMASKDESEVAQASFRPNWWIRGGLGVLFALIAYANLPIAWKYLEQQQSDTQVLAPPRAPSPATPADPMAAIWVNAAKEALAQYEMVKRSGSPADICLQASVVSQSFLQANDEPNYAMWKRTEILDCGRAGIGDQSAYLNALAEDMKEKGEKSELAQQVKGLVGQPDASSVVERLSDNNVTTPFGTLGVNDVNQLILNGHVASPVVQGNNALVIQYRVPLGTGHAILVGNLGGTACPALYRWVMFNKDGVNVTEEFGTCSDLAEPTLRNSKAVITLPRERQDSTQENVRYEYDGQELEEFVEK